jgi:hypothetical protein
MLWYLWWLPMFAEGDDGTGYGSGGSGELTRERRGRHGGRRIL